MTWLLVMIFGMSVSNSVVTEEQCTAALRANANVSRRLGIEITAFCVDPKGNIHRLGPPT